MFKIDEIIKKVAILVTVLFVCRSQEFIIITMKIIAVKMAKIILTIIALLKAIAKAS